MFTKILPALFATLSILVGCAHAEPTPIAPAAPAWLNAKIEAEVAPAAPGAIRIGEFFTGVAREPDDWTDWYVELKTGHCYWFSGHGDDMVEQLGLYLWSPAGRRTASVRSPTGKALIMHCPMATGMFKMQARVNEGRGHYAVGVYVRAATTGAVMEPPPAGASDAADGMGPVVDSEAAVLAPGARRTGEYYTSTAPIMEWYINMEAGHCYWIVGVGGPGVSSLFLYLWGPDGRRVTENRSVTPKVSVGHCPEVTGMYKFQTKIWEGTGPYTLGVYVKASDPPESPPTPE